MWSRVLLKSVEAATTHEASEGSEKIEIDNAKIDHSRSGENRYGNHIGESYH